MSPAVLSEPQTNALRLPLESRLKVALQAVDDVVIVFCEPQEDGHGFLIGTKNTGLRFVRLTHTTALAAYELAYATVSPLRLTNLPHASGEKRGNAHKVVQRLRDAIETAMPGRGKAIVYEYEGMYTILAGRLTRTESFEMNTMFFPKELMCRLCADVPVQPGYG